MCSQHQGGNEKPNHDKRLSEAFVLIWFFVEYRNGSLFARKINSQDSSNNNMLIWRLWE